MSNHSHQLPGTGAPQVLRADQPPPALCLCRSSAWNLVLTCCAPSWPCPMSQNSCHLLQEATFGLPKPLGFAEDTVLPSLFCGTVGTLCSQLPGAGTGVALSLWPQCQRGATSDAPQANAHEG